MGLCDIFGKPIATGGDSDYFNVTYPGYTNLFDGIFEVGLLNSGGSINSATTAARTTMNYIDISGGTYVYPQYSYSFTYNPERKATGNTYMYRAIAFYDDNKNFLELRQNSADPRTDGNFEVQAIPTGAKYCRVSWSVAYGNGFDDPTRYFVGVAADNSAAVLPWEQYYAPGETKTAYLRMENLSVRDKPLHEGKTWVLFGDSLTDSYGGHDWQENTAPVGGIGWKETEDNVPWTGYYWATRIAREFGLTIDNRAASGSNINQSRVYPTVTGIIKLDAFLTEIEAGAIEQPEYITIGFGTNTVADEIGTADDTSDNTESIYGATKYFVEKLREKCPYSVIGFVLPPVGDWTGVSDVRSIDGGRAAIKAVLDEYSVPYIDMSKESGITVDMLPDGIHVSSIEANNLYCHAMRRFMMGL